MKQVFLVGLIIAGLWGMAIAGLDGEPMAPSRLAGVALGGALLAVIVFLAVLRFSESGYFVLSIVLLVVTCLSYMLLVPLATVVVESLFLGDFELLADGIYWIFFDMDYWWFRFQEPQYNLVPSLDLIFIALVVTIISLRDGSGSEAAMNQGSTSTGNAAYAGLARHHNWSEINRLFLAHAWTGGSSFRRSVIDRASEPFDAPALEVGIDMERLVKLCLWREGKETGYRMVLLLFLVAAFFGFVVAAEEEDPGILMLVLLTVAVINGIRRAQIHGKIHRLYGLNDFSLDQASEAGGVSLSKEQTRGLSPEGQNVVVYSGFTPFEFAGIAMGGWSVSIDTSRPSSGIAAVKKVTPFTEGELRSFLTDCLRESQIRGLSVHDLVVAQGMDAPGLPTAHSYMGVSQPRVQLDAEEMDSLAGEQPNTFRRYTWISMGDWGGELLVSAFWRGALKEHMLQVELSHFLLTPIESKHRKVDMTGATWRHAIRQFTTGAALSPVDLVAGPLTLLAHFQLGLAKLFGSKERDRAKEIAVNPRYNFGAPPSLRVQLMGGNFLHYFQKMDQEHYQRSLDKILLEGLVSFLDDHGVDTADLKETQTAIFNSGVIVQGGDITAQSLAVGEKAKARTGIVDRALGRSGAKSESAKKS